MRQASVAHLCCCGSSSAVVIQANSRVTISRTANVQVNRYLLSAEKGNSYITDKYGLLDLSLFSHKVIRVISMQRQTTMPKLYKCYEMPPQQSFIVLVVTISCTGNMKVSWRLQLGFFCYCQCSFSLFCPILPGCFLPRVPIPVRKAFWQLQRCKDIRKKKRFGAKGFDKISLRPLSGVGFGSGERK